MHKQKTYKMHVKILHDREKITRAKFFPRQLYKEKNLFLFFRRSDARFYMQFFPKELGFRGRSQCCYFSKAAHAFFYSLKQYIFVADGFFMIFLSQRGRDL
jgi:hypothetical protein